jgi:hypothetical protein
MKHPVVILISACIASAGFVGWRMNAMRTQAADHFGLVYDPSISFTGGCPSLVGAAGEILRSPDVSVGSTLTVLTLGDDSTAREPRRLATYTIPVNRKVIEGRRASVERRESLLQELWARCSSLQPTTVSPIFLAVQQAVADLRADGCKKGSRCALWVSTDLEENADRAIENRINRGRHAARLPARALDNTGIAVTFCGFAATAGRLVGSSGREIGKAVTRGPRRDDRLQAVWRSLFTRPESVEFQPYCPEPAILPVHGANVGDGAEMWENKTGMRERHLTLQEGNQ